MPEHAEQVRDAKARFGVPVVGRLRFPMQMATNQSGRWQDKLHPIFFEMAAANRQCEQDLKQIEEEHRRVLQGFSATTTLPERQAAFDLFKSRTDDRLAELARKMVDIDAHFGVIPYNPSPFGYLYTPAGEVEGDDATFFRFLHWMRHHESLDATARRDEAGDMTAWDDVHRTGIDVRVLKHTKGPIKAWKIDPIHRQLHQLIMSYEVEPLTADERAECFDEFCPCGQLHDADALKKQYRRLKKDLAK